ncbi:MAG: hypothetical protein ACLQDQ_18915 [Myxococcaceae bacterium]
MLITLVALLVAASPDPKALPLSVLKMAVPHSGTKSDAAMGGTKGYGGNHGNGGGGSSGVPGIDSLKNWTGQFTEPGFDGNGNPQSVWPYAMVGRAPEQGGTTHFHAPVIPVIVELLDQNGNIALAVDGTPLVFDPKGYIKPVLQSPVFSRWPYTSGRSEWTDAIFRAEFFNRLPGADKGPDEDCDSGDGWHNLLDPDVKKAETMQIPYGFWYYVLNADGSCCAAAIVDEGTFGNALFPPTYPVDNTTVIGAAELSGAMTTKDVTTLLFNNVYLYEGTIANCCVLGFHTYDYEPGTPANGNLPRLYVFNYASWITNGLFLGGFEDVTALSHEMSELFNDPFVNNWTPWYLSPSGLCQNNLETGDAIEGLASNAVFSLQLSNRTYHPQNEAMFPWFAFESPSPALNGAYSFPDETTLTTLSPPNLLPGCVPAP